MKTKPILAVALLAATSALYAASDTPKVELRADSMTTNGRTTIAKGSAVAVVGDLRVSAPEIELDRETGILRCRGEATIRTSWRTVRATDATINSKEKNPEIRASSIRVQT